MEEEIMKIIVDLLKSKKIRFEINNRFDNFIDVFFDSCEGSIQIDDDEIYFYSELEEEGRENLYYSNLKFSSIDTLILQIDEFIFEMNYINDVLFAIKNHLKTINNICEKHKINFNDIITIENNSLK